MTGLAGGLTAAVVGLGAVCVVLTVLVLGLLRSHADVLRALAELGVRFDADPTTAAAGPAPFQVRPQVVAPPTGRTATGTPPAAIAGTDVDGDAVLIAPAGAPATVLAFLSSGCSSCEGFWAAFADPALRLPAGARLVVVAQDRDTESPARLAPRAAALRPGGVPVVLSSAAWEDYGVPAAPYFVLIDGVRDRVAGEGSAGSWEQVAGLLSSAAADAALLAPRPGTAPPDPRDRADRADAELAAAGLRPDDPSFYAPGVGVPAQSAGR